MKAANARIIWSHCRLSVVGAKQRYDREPPAVSILRAFVTLTTSGLRPKHVSQEFLEIDEFGSMFGSRERERSARFHRMYARGISV